MPFRRQLVELRGKTTTSADRRGVDDVCGIPCWECKSGSSVEVLPEGDQRHWPSLSSSNWQLLLKWVSARHVVRHCCTLQSYWNAEKHDFASALSRMSAWWYLDHYWWLVLFYLAGCPSLCQSSKLLWRILSIGVTFYFIDQWSHPCWTAENCTKWHTLLICG